MLNESIKNRTKNAEVGRLSDCIKIKSKGFSPLVLKIK